MLYIILYKTNNFDNIINFDKYKYHICLAKFELDKVKVLTFITRYKIFRYVNS